MRNTKTRQEVIDFLIQKKQAYTPYEIAAELGMNTVTVYRVLDFLKSQKSVHHIQALSKWSACRCADDSKDHGFMICRKCESVAEFLSPHHCVHAHGFHCDEHIVEVLGTCRACSTQS